MDGIDFVTGRHRYPSDQKLPGMLYGKVVRPNVFEATLVSVDTQKAEQMGVTVVHDGNFIGVAAPTRSLLRPPRQPFMRSGKPIRSLPIRISSIISGRMSWRETTSRGMATGLIRDQWTRR